MLSEVIFKEETDVTDKLAFFGVTAPQLLQLAHNVATARSQATPLHAANAAGTFAYHEGVRGKRELFISNQTGWVAASYKGIEAVENHDKGLIVVFQNVTQACSSNSPKAISGKKTGSKELVESNNNFELFPETKPQKTLHENKSVWYLCVSSDIENVKVELSRPTSIDDNGQFSAFSERIFITDYNGDFEPIDTKNSRERYEADDFEIYKIE
ncbi:hypothetical protein [Neptunomonas concharum]|uniref:Uncharacterized protein n=1 Tax=Neptunomonas concharum TaxID=1031538 RepID=A0A5P1R9I8_9GAMM|nr:hypothetical protein [Neptunomonas concharum]QEQ96257.1 hypothetical protein F0U83_05795 [Neptunomonas concharum]